MIALIATLLWSLPAQVRAKPSGALEILLSDSFVNPMQIGVNLDQTTEENVKESDLLGASSNNGISINGDDINILFNHLLSKLYVTYSFKSDLNDKNVKGENLLSFGDGFVEIELVKNVGGYAVAVATDEQNQCGVNEQKRARLLCAGAHAAGSLPVLQGGDGKGIRPRYLP